MQNAKITIIMPAYNSAGTIERSLKSVRMQDYPQDLIEILVIDGGSTDDTVEIAKKYGAVIIKNKKRLPEYAKEIGIVRADGKYGVFMDTDEVMIQKETLTKRVEILQKNKRVKNIVSAGLICDASASPVTRYANYTGDPFSYFIYRQNGYNRIENRCRSYCCKKIEDYYIYRFRPDDPMPLFDAGVSMFDLEEAKKLYAADENPSNFASSLSAVMMRKFQCVCIREGDMIYHLPLLTFPVYLSKLKWRVLNNVFNFRGG